MDRDEVEVHKNAKKEGGQYPAILTEQAWSIKDLLYGFIFKLGVQKNPKQEMKLFCSAGQKFFPAGWCKFWISI